ncbi:hypothetical protein Tco_0780464 [Tanacetum coccineum]
MVVPLYEIRKDDVHDRDPYKMYIEFMGLEDSEQTVNIEEGDGEEYRMLDNDYLKSRKNIYATYQWFSKELVQQLKTNPYIPVRAVQEQLTQKHELNVTQSKAFRAKQEAEKKLRGDYTQQYKMLRDYVMELQETNPKHTVQIDVSIKQIMSTNKSIKRIYNTEAGQGFLTQLGEELELYRELPTQLCYHNQQLLFVSRCRAEIRCYNLQIPEVSKAMEKDGVLAKKLMSGKCILAFNGKLVGGRDKPILFPLGSCQEYFAEKSLRANSNQATKYTVVSVGWARSGDGLWRGPGHNSRSYTGHRVAKTNKRKVPTTWMDDTHAPTGSQANKRPKTQGVGSASGKQQTKGRLPS